MGHASSRSVALHGALQRLGRKKTPRIIKEKLEIHGRGTYVFDSHPEKGAPSQGDALHLVVRLKKGHNKGYQGRKVALLSDRPALHQLASHPEVKPKEVRVYCELVLDVLRSMRFLELSPDAMRIPSLPGQNVLGDRGENLSSVLQAVCKNPMRKRALTAWLRELTPLDVADFEFPSDQTGRVLVSLVEEGGVKTSAYSASDGTLRFLAMIAAFLGPDSAHFYFFEELETGLHPTRLHLLLSLVEQQTRRREAQVVATTHSPQLLAFLSRDTLECASLTYRLSGTPEQRVRRILDIPEARRLVDAQDAARLFASGWLEDAVELTQAIPTTRQVRHERPRHSGGLPQRPVLARADHRSALQSRRQTESASNRLQGSAARRGSRGAEGRQPDRDHRLDAKTDVLVPRADEVDRDEARALRDRMLASVGDQIARVLERLARMSLERRPRPVSAGGRAAAARIR